MVGRGRPFGSKIRQSIVEILKYLDSGYGYEIHKLVCETYKKCTREVVYYHLKRGVKTGEFKVQEIKVEKGNFSWGPEVRKIVYSLGENAKPTGLEDVKKIVEEYKNSKN